MKTSRNLTPAKAVEILKEHGTELTLEEAEAVLEPMCRLAEVAGRQLKNSDQIALLHQQSTIQGS